MQITKTKLKKIIKEEYDKLFAGEGHQSHQSAYDPDENVFTFVDDPDDNSPWIINPDTGEKWVDYDPMGDNKTHWTEEGVHPEDVADAASVVYEENLSTYGDNHPKTISALKDYMYYKREARSYAQKHNLTDSEYFSDVNDIPSTTDIDSSIQTIDTGGLGREHGSDRTPWTGTVQRTTSLSPASTVNVPQRPRELLTPFEQPVTESLKK